MNESWHTNSWMFYMLSEDVNCTVLRHFSSSYSRFVFELPLLLLKCTLSWINNMSYHNFNLFWSSSYNKRGRREIAGWRALMNTEGKLRGLGEGDGNVWTYIGHGGWTNWTRLLSTLDKSWNANSQTEEHRVFFIWVHIGLLNCSSWVTQIFGDKLNSNAYSECETWANDFMW